MYLLLHAYLNVLLELSYVISILQLFEKKFLVITFRQQAAYSDFIPGPGLFCNSEVLGLRPSYLDKFNYFCAVNFISLRFRRHHS